MGAADIIVRTKEPNAASEKDANSRVKTYGLLRKDYRRIVENIPNIRRAVPMRELRFELRLGNRIADAKFLTETVVLTANGGLLGVLFGLSVGHSFAVNRRGSR